MAIWEKIINFFNEKFAQVKQMPAEQKRHLILVCTACFSAVLTLTVIISVFQNANGEKKPEEPEQIYINIPIPAEELFLPDEPDFIPGVLLDRDRRAVWTEEDVMEYWQDPLKEGEEPWRIKIETAIDEILERVP